MVNKRKVRRKLQSEPMLAAEEIYILLRRMGGTRERGRLALLWENWREAIGSDLASMAEPAGSRGSLLLVRVNDAMQMQELHFLSAELLGRVNDYLQNPYFESVRLTVHGQGRKGGTKSVRGAEISPEAVAFAASEAPSGKFLPEMDRSSPVAACYARFARRK